MIWVESDVETGLSQDIDAYTDTATEDIDIDTLIDRHRPVGIIKVGTTLIMEMSQVCDAFGQSRVILCKGT